MLMQNQVGDPVGEHTGLARTCPCKDQKWAFGMEYSFALYGVEGVEKGVVVLDHSAHCTRVDKRKKMGIYCHSATMLHTIDFTGTTPRHQQVYDQLLQCIRDGHWQLGAKIPAELEIAAALGVAKLTVHRAVQALAKDGWVTRLTLRLSHSAKMGMMPVLPWQ